MKFTLAVVTLLAALTSTRCFAQSVNIRSPVNGTFVNPNSSFVLDLGWQTNTTSYTEIGIIVGIIPCLNTTCPPLDTLGSLLYNGSFKPVSPASSSSGQNFTLNIPSTFPPGPAQLTVLNLVLVGPNNDFWMNTTSINLGVANTSSTAGH